MTTDQETVARKRAWELQSSIYEGFSTEIWDDAAEPGKRSIAVVRDYQDAVAIMSALSRTEQAEAEINRLVAVVGEHVTVRGEYLTRAEQAEAERDALKAEAKRDREHREHTEYWYACRLERLKDLGKERGCWPEMAAIIANGSATRQMEDGWHYEPPTYAQQFNILKHRAEAAEGALKDRDDEIARLRAAVREFCDGVENSLFIDRRIKALASKLRSALLKGGNDA